MDYIRVAATVGREAVREVRHGCTGILTRAGRLRGWDRCAHCAFNSGRPVSSIVRRRGLLLLCFRLLLMVLGVARGSVLAGKYARRPRFVRPKRVTTLTDRPDDPYTITSIVRPKWTLTSPRRSVSCHVCLTGVAVVCYAVGGTWLWVWVCVECRRPLVRVASNLLQYARCPPERRYCRFRGVVFRRAACRVGGPSRFSSLRGSFSLLGSLLEFCSFLSGLSFAFFRLFLLIFRVVCSFVNWCVRSRGRFSALSFFLFPVFFLFSFPFFLFSFFFLFLSFSVFLFFSCFRTFFFVASFILCVRVLLLFFFLSFLSILLSPCLLMVLSSFFLPLLAFFLPFFFCFLDWVSVL